MVTRQLAAHLPPAPARVIDVGCGQGTQSLRLARAGYAVTGVEPDPAMREAFSAALAEERVDVRQRVELLVGSLDDLPAAPPYDVVLCHGVLMYVPDPRPAVRALAAAVAPGGLLSLLVRNADGMAMRPGLRRDWAGVQAMLDAAESDDPAGRTYTNELGVRARADRVDELVALLRRRRIRPEAWYGVRVLTDGVASGTPLPEDPAEVEAMLAAEERVGRTDPYRRVATLAHLVGRARLRPDDEPEATLAAYDSAGVQALVARVQDEYVVRYGGPDVTRVDPRQFDPPHGVFLLLDVEGEPVGCGGYRRHDERSAEVKRMYVVPEHRGRGISRFLLQELERRARAAGYTRLLLETGLAQPEAMALYESSGYARVPGFGHYRESPDNRCYAKDL